MVATGTGVSSDSGTSFFEVGPNAFENPPKAIPARRGFLQVDLAASIVPFDPTFQPLSSAFPLPTPTIGATPSNGQVTPTASSSGIVFYSTVISIITGSTATISLITPISSPEPTAAVQLPPSPAHKISQTSLIAAVASASGIFVVVFVLILVWWCRRRRRRRRLEEKDSVSETATSPYPESTQRLNAYFAHPSSPSDASTRPPSYSDTDPATTTLYSPTVSPASPQHYHYRLRRMLSQEAHTSWLGGQHAFGLRRPPPEERRRTQSRGSDETRGSDSTGQILHVARRELMNIWLPTTPRTAFSEAVPAYPPSPPPPLYLRRHDVGHDVGPVEV